MPRIQMFFVPMEDRREYELMPAIKRLLARITYFTVDPETVNFTCYNLQTRDTAIILVDFTDNPDQKSLLEQNERAFDEELSSVLGQFSDLFEYGVVIAHVRCKIKFVKRVDAMITHAS